METLLQDLRYGVRMLSKNPGFTTVAVLTLALGIGANTAIFTVVNAVLLRPLPFDRPEQLVMVFTKTSQQARNWVTYPDLQDWQTQSQSFIALSAIVPQSVNLTGVEEPTRVIGGFVSANFFQMLQIKAAQGRAFLPGEDKVGAARVVVVSYAAWQGRFGREPKLIGQTLILNGQPFTVVGILPESFHFSWSDCDVWLPIQYYPNFTLNRHQTSAGVIGRLKPAVAIAQARSEMDTIARRLAAQYPDTNSDRGVMLVPFHDFLVEQLRPSLLVLWGAVGFVLLIACANVANLLLARSVVRQKEIALRAALGAGRWRLARQLLTEAVLLALVGGSLGLLLGKWGMDVLVASSAAGLPDTTAIKLDLPVLGFALGIAALTGIIFGLAPALRFSSPDVHAALKEGGKGSGESLGRSRLRSLLVVSQIALALVLLIGAGLLLKSFRTLLQVKPGFNPTGLLTLEYRVPRNKYPQGRQQWEFHRQVVERVQALAGVQSASVVLALPYSGNGGVTTFVPLGQPEPPQGAEPRAQVNRADPYYFHTVGIPLLRGRVFTKQDGTDSPPVVIINQVMAERYWSNEDPIGKNVRLPDTKVTATVVGIVGNVKHFSLDEQTTSQIYLAYAQNPHIFATLVVRTAGDPLSFANSIKQAVWSVDKDQPVWKIRTLESLIDLSVGPRRLMMRLLACFSGLALLLAAVGIYGVISYSVSRRTHEIGVRIAVGAQQGDVLKLVVGQGLIMTLLGVIFGLAASFGLTRFLDTMLFGVGPTDALTFAALSLLLTAVALVACYLPARRATKVDPMVALRCE
ncbi:MAG TPA: ABC transporter permease [Acidobacteriota bacterium]|jgi:putative ABC transport system permease protein|nr:ABC transporter permease [Acidobacteriota bacterium]